MFTTKQREAAEAVCSGLYQTSFQFLGESEDGRITYFTRGTKPQIMSVSVSRFGITPHILVNCAWPNLSLRGKVIKGTETLQIDCGDTENDEMIKHQTGLAVVRCIEIFRDVLLGEGVAGAAALQNLTFD